MATHVCPHCSVSSQFSALTTVNATDGQKWAIFRCVTCGGDVFGRADPEQFLYPTGRDAASAELPDDVRRNMDEAIRAFNAKIPGATVVMARGALQAAMRNEGAKGSNLRDEIDDLAAKHVIPVSLSEWAHQLRDGGNLVAHPEPGKTVEMEDARELLDLAESLFEYLYVIPAQIQARRAKKAVGP